MAEIQKKSNISEDFKRQRFAIFKEHLICLFEKLTPHVLREKTFESLTEREIIDLWEEIEKKYAPMISKFKESKEYNIKGKIQKEFVKNIKPPSGKRINDFIKHPELTSIADSDLLEKTGIAYFYIIENDKHDEEWLIEYLSKDLTKKPVFKYQLETENKDYYLLYYSTETLQIEYAIIEILRNERYTDFERPANAILYYSNFKEKGLNVVGKMTDTKQNIFFDFEAGTENEKIKSLVSLYKGNKSDGELHYLLGTYSTIERNGTPVCGMAILEKHISKEKAEYSMRTHQSKNYPIIKNLLYYKRIIVKQVSADKLSDFPEYPNIEAVKENYAGYYKIKVISVTQKKLFQLYGIIKRSGETEIKFPGGIICKGVFKLAQDKNILHAELEYNFNDGYYKFQVILKGTKKLIRNDYVEGVYAGIGVFSNEPTAGRVLLQFLDPYFDADSKKKLLNSEPKSISLDSSEQDSLNANQLERNFFLGNKDSFIESQSYLESAGVHSDGKTKTQSLEKRIEALETLMLSMQSPQQ